MKNAITVLFFLAIIFLPIQASSSMEAGPHGEGDPSGDGIMSAQDTLILINIINSGEEPEQDILFRGDVAPGYVVGEDDYCTTGDGLIAPADVLVLINMINALETNFAPLDSCEYDFDQDGFVDEYSPGGVDCDDTDPQIYPCADELCDDGLDTDCDGFIDSEETDCMPGCTDDDCDGYADEGNMCGLVDCDDTDPDVHPGAEDQCDGIDQNCDGTDGVPEIPDNGIDDDCDGQVDESCFIEIVIF